ncbi:hypothetical protein Leryth_020456 [Lithospermum erythrorhizon]|nr:hypothetical protein Leryth_020456 [Lithospermum erythrorhizon]
MEIPCGLMLGSHVTVDSFMKVLENDPKITIKKENDDFVLISQFMMELQAEDAWKKGGQCGAKERSRVLWVRITGCKLCYASVMDEDIEWPEENYPLCKIKLQLFKMEDVSVGMWVEKFNSSKPVEYVHSLKFCQFGCIPDYYTAHYQSPRQMICLWRKLQKQGNAHCCNMR